MRLLDMLFRRREPEREPDRSEEIERLTDEHVKAANGVVTAGILSPQDARIRRAIEATGRAVRADRMRER